MGVLEVETVAGTRDNSDLEVGGVGEHGLGGFRDRVEAGWGGEAVSTTEWEVSLASDDEDWGLGWVHAASGTSDGEELTDGYWLASHCSNLENLGVKVSLLHKCQLTYFVIKMLQLCLQRRSWSEQQMR